MASIAQHQHASQFAFNAVSNSLPPSGNQPHEATHSTSEAAPSDMPTRSEQLATQMRKAELDLEEVRMRFSKQQASYQQDVDSLASIEEEIEEIGRKLSKYEDQKPLALELKENLLMIQKNIGTLLDLERISGQSFKADSAKKKQKGGEEPSQGEIRKAETLRQQIKFGIEGLEKWGISLQGSDPLTFDFQPLLILAIEQINTLPLAQAAGKLSRESLMERKVDLERSVLFNKNLVSALKKWVETEENQIAELQQELEKELEVNEALKRALASPPTDQETGFEGTIVFVSGDRLIEAERGQALAGPPTDQEAVFNDPIIFVSGDRFAEGGNQNRAVVSASGDLETEKTGS